MTGKFKKDDKVALLRAIDPSDTYWSGYGLDKAIVDKVEKSFYQIIGNEGKGHSMYVKEDEIILRNNL